MDVRPIKTEADYQAALKEIERLFDAAPSTSESARNEVFQYHLKLQMVLNSPTPSEAQPPFSTSLVQSSISQVEPHE